MALIRKIQAYTELVNTRLPQFKIAFHGHMRPVGDQDGVRDRVAVLDAIVSRLLEEKADEKPRAEEKSEKESKADDEGK